MKPEALRRHGYVVPAERVYKKMMPASVQDFAKLYTAWFGEPDEVITFGDVNIFVFAPKAEDAEGFWMYLTGGMSLKQVELPPRARDAKELSRAEYVFYSARKDPRYIDMLTLLIIFPFVDKTFVSEGHTVGLSEAISDSGLLTAVVLLKTLFRGHAMAFDAVRVAGEPINYLWVVPITESERQCKRVHGYNDFLDLLDRAKNPIVFPGDREAYV